MNDYAREGGAEEVVHATARLLAARGHEVATLLGDAEGLRRAGPLGYVDSWRARRVLAARLASWRPDVVHVHNFYHVLSPGILATLLRWKRGGAGAGVGVGVGGAGGAVRRVVMTAHDGHVLSPNPLLHVFSREAGSGAGSGAGRGVGRGRAERAADVGRLGELGYVLGQRWDRRGAAHSWLRVAQHVWNYRVHRRLAVLDAVVCPGRTLLELCRGAGLPAVWVPNPAFVQARAGMEAGADGARRADGPLEVVFVGRVEPEKRLAACLQSWPGGPGGGERVRLRVLGDGSDLARCRAIAAERGLAAEFFGRVDAVEVARALRRAHAVVIPSLDEENDPLCLLEGVAAGANVLGAMPGCDGGRGTGWGTGIGRGFEGVEGLGFVYDPAREGGLVRALEAMHAARAAGRLNAFDPVAALAHREPGAYVERLLRVYAGEMG